jgi:two-component system, sensor histidine kinase and response regulator
MGKKSLAFWFVVFLMGTGFSYAQQESARLNTFMDRFSRLEHEQKYDSVTLVISRFSELENLTSYEKAGFYLYKSIYYKRISRYDEAIAISKKGLEYCKGTGLFAIFKKRLLINIADIYFTMLKYDEAYRYAEQAKKIAVECYYDIDNYSITGAWLEMNRRYAESIREYEKALQLIKKYHTNCKASEVTSKLAHAYIKARDFNKGIDLINNSISLADSCGQMVNSINARKSKYTILKDLKKYKEANEIYDTIILLEGKYAFNLRNEKMDMHEAKYQNQLKTQKNASLKLINRKNNEVIARQRIILYCTVLVILIFSFLVYFLIKFYRKQRETNRSLALQKIQIEDTNKELQRLNLLNQKIFSVISHDFKGPITTLKLMLSNDAIKKTENSTVAPYLREIGSQLEQSDAMLESLLDWAKTELKIKAGEHKLYTVYDLVSEVVGQLQSKLDEKELTAVVSIDNAIRIDFPREVLKIVFRNIISNAIKFSNPKSSIEISFSDNKLTVKDYGKGMPKNKLDKLFNQAINPGLGTFQESGFGIGLYLSYELMQKNNGTIIAQNNKDTGCTFSIVLP